MGTGFFEKRRGASCSPLSACRWSMSAFCLGLVAAFSPAPGPSASIIAAALEALALEASGCTVAHTEESSLWQTFGIMFACAETHDGKEWTTHHEVDISYAGRVIAIKKSIDVTDVPGDVMEAAEAAGASACTSYWYELMHDIYELDECAGGEHYEVDATTLEVES